MILTKKVALCRWFSHIACRITSSIGLVFTF